MDNLLSYKSIPVGSLIILPDDIWPNYIEPIIKLPLNLRRILFSPRTGAYLRGIGNSYNLPPERVPQISLLVLKVCLGEITLSQLSGLLASELSLGKEVAEKVGREIEKDIFTPVALELNHYLKQNHSTGGTPAAAAPNETYGARNVLDLKQPPQPPLPPPLPR